MCIRDRENRGPEASRERLEPGEVTGGPPKQKIEVHRGDRRALERRGGVADQHRVELHFAQTTPDIPKQRCRIHPASIGDGKVADTLAIIVVFTSATPASLTMTTNSLVSSAVAGRLRRNRGYRSAAGVLVGAIMG